jgi:hypothetical protein
MFLSTLWDNPAQRKRWALRWRTRAVAHDLAENLGWHVAADVQQGGILPLNDLATTIQHALLDGFAEGLQLAGDDDDPVFYGINHRVTRTLDWLIRHKPATAAHTIGRTIGEAERRLSIPRRVSEKSLRMALALDSKLDTTSRKEFLDRVLSPQPNTPPSA